MLAEEGGTATLHCSAPASWFFCVWEGPAGGRVCGLQEAGGVAALDCGAGAGAGHSRLGIAGLLRGAQLQLAGTSSLRMVVSCCRKSCLQTLFIGCRVEQQNHSPFSSLTSCTQVTPRCAS